jgi:cytoskeletal protein RodZ
MRTVGQILQSERKKQKKTLVDIYKKTKIPSSTLKRIEADQFDKMPPATFTKGFLHNYASSLGLDPKKIIAIFRRDYLETKKGTILPRELSEDISQPKFGFNPRTFSLISLGVLVFAFIFYFSIQLRTILIPPKITLNELPSIVNNEELVIKGKVSRESVVTINGQLVSVEDKTFSHKMLLLSGKNSIEVKAVDRRQKESIETVEVWLDKKE